MPPANLPENLITKTAFFAPRRPPQVAPYRRCDHTRSGPLLSTMQAFAWINIGRRGQCSHTGVTLRAAAPMGRAWR